MPILPTCEACNYSTSSSSSASSMRKSVIVSIISFLLIMLPSFFYHIAALTVRFHPSLYESEVSSSLPWASDICSGQLICLWADFCLSLFDPTFGSASLPPLEPFDNHLPPFGWLSCSSNPECRISDHSCIWKPFNHRFLDDLP